MEPVHLTEEKETLLATLYGRALDSRSERPILGDRFADEIVRRLDFDFEQLELPKGADISLPVRAKHFDGWTREFLAANPRSTVLHLGCGLDSRAWRIDPPGDVRWYDVDHPEVIELRRQLYPERPGYEMIGSSVTDLRWLDAVPAERPVLVVAEGLVIYLREAEGIALFRAITEKFPSGQLIFDAYSRSMVWLTARLPAVKKTGAVLSWGIDDPRQIEKEVPRLRLISDVPFLTMPELVSRLARSRVQRAMSALLSRTGFVQRLVRHLRYRF
jgi:O-methyltransferase involved in polyketide biosynthesis